MQDAIARFIKEGGTLVDKTATLVDYVRLTNKDNQTVLVSSLLRLVQTTDISNSTYIGIKKYLRDKLILSFSITRTTKRLRALIATIDKSDKLQYYGMDIYYNINQVEFHQSLNFKLISKETEVTQSLDIKVNCKEKQFGNISPS